MEVRRTLDLPAGHSGLPEPRARRTDLYPASLLLGPGEYRFGGRCIPTDQRAGAGQWHSVGAGSMNRFPNSQAECNLGA